MPNKKIWKIIDLSISEKEEFPFDLGAGDQEYSGDAHMPEVVLRCPYCNGPTHNYSAGCKHVILIYDGTDGDYDYPNDKVKSLIKPILDEDEIMAEELFSEKFSGKYKTSEWSYVGPHGHGSCGVIFWFSDDPIFIE